MTAGRRLGARPSELVVGLKLVGFGADHPHGVDRDCASAGERAAAKNRARWRGELQASTSRFESSEDDAMGSALQLGRVLVPEFGVRDDDLCTLDSANLHESHAAELA